MPPRLLDLQHQKENKYWDGEFQEAKADIENTLHAVVLNRVCRND